MRRRTELIFQVAIDNGNSANSNKLENDLLPQIVSALIDWQEKSPRKIPNTEIQQDLAISDLVPALDCQLIDFEEGRGNFYVLLYVENHYSRFFSLSVLDYPLA